MSEERLDVLVAGDLFVDLVMSGFAAWPPSPGQEVFAERFYKEAGGGASITACGLAKLGVKTGVLGVVGEVDGQWVLDRLRSNDVNTSLIGQSAEEPTAVTVSVSSATERTFLTYMGANRELPAMLQRCSSRGEFVKARHVHLASAPEPAEAANLFLRIADQSCSLSVDVGWHPEWLSDARGREALHNVDVFLPNEREAALMTGETEPRRILEAFRKMGIKRVALKLGPGGSALLCDEEIMFCAPIPVQAVDTTGAGDCFDAGFLFAWLRGDDPQSCLKAGTVCGALSTRNSGGITGFPTLAELDAHR
jgi:sugar/nucleoside kinase (ribokinase family)